MLSVAPFVPNEVLVKFKEGVAEADIANLQALLKTSQVERIQTDAMRAANSGSLELLSGPADVLGTVAKLKDNPLVEYAEPNWIYSHQAVSNDPYYVDGNLWGMYGDDQPSPSGPLGTTNPYGSQAETAWNAGYTGSNTVYVGIIDEGIQFTHPDLIANVWNNPYDNPSDGIDNDGNGFIDDDHGWDFARNDNTIYDNRNDDHGTHVSGTIGAQGGNGTGVAGVNWNVKYISGKFLGPNGGTTANAIKALDYMTDLKVRHGLNIVATNNSWGGGGYSQGLLDAITRAAKQDILFIAAAGNSGSNNDASASYPSNYDTTVGTATESAASYDAVIAVAAINSGGGLASFSSYGANKVDLGAPGQAIYSTLPTDSYGSYSGTSMATPHVTGAAALYASANPLATAAQIKSAILGSTKPTSSLTGKTVTGGRLDVGGLMGTGSGPTSVLSINNVTGDEGSSGMTSFTFTVTLSPASNSTVTVDYATENGMADSSDFSTLPLTTLTFLAGETSKTVTVDVTGDTTSETNETFFVNLGNASAGATIAGSQGVGTILNDDGLLSINNVTQAEGNSGSTAFNFSVSLQNASTQTVTVDYATVDGSAVSVDDYTAVTTPTTLTFDPGQTSKTITINVTGDTSIEPDENFFVILSNPNNADYAINQGVGTILNDDGLPALPSLSINSVSNPEGDRGNTTFTFTVTLSATSTSPVTVQYATADGTAFASGKNKDYNATSGELTFNFPETSKTITVSVRGDTSIEPEEAFYVNLSNPTNASLAIDQGMGTILNDDGGTAGLSATRIATYPTPTTLNAKILQVAQSAIPIVPLTGRERGSDTAAIDAYYGSLETQPEWLVPLDRHKPTEELLEEEHFSADLHFPHVAPFFPS